MLPDEDLKKPLRVQFVGEEGVDEGGVQKEYFQVQSCCYDAKLRHRHIRYHFLAIENEL